MPRDVQAIHQIVEPYAERGILLAKELVSFYEAVQEFYVAESNHKIVGCGALHVMWEDLAEVRTLAVASHCTGQGIGRRLLRSLLWRAQELEIPRVFCLTFEVDFFRANGFKELPGPGVPEPVFGQLLRSHDDGVAEFLELSRVKANTLGNTRMITYL